MTRGPRSEAEQLDAAAQYWIHVKGKAYVQVYAVDNEVFGPSLLEARMPARRSRRLSDK